MVTYHNFIDINLCPKKNIMKEKRNYCKMWYLY